MTADTEVIPSACWETAAVEESTDNALADFVALKAATDKLSKLGRGKVVEDVVTSADQAVIAGQCVLKRIKALEREAETDALYIKTLKSTREKMTVRNAALSEEVNTAQTALQELRTKIAIQGEAIEIKSRESQLTNGRLNALQHELDSYEIWAKDQIAAQDAQIETKEAERQSLTEEVTRIGLNLER
jgi:chromosome segregation ATPase